VTGTRALVSDFDNRAQGPTGSRPSAIAIEAAGTAIIADPAAGRAQQGALFRVNPSTGARVLLSDFGNPRQGETGDDPGGVAIDGSGAILVIDPAAGSAGKLFRVDPGNGNRTVVSDFGDRAQGPTGSSPEGVAVEASGTILVIDPNAGTALNGALFRVDPGTGNRSLLSDFGDDRQGPVGSSPGHVAVEASGTIVVTDPGIGDGGALVRVDPSTGARAIVSDFGSLSDGPLGEHPAGVSVVEAPSSSR
jgi:sugar lactone lactonase YvrE